MLHPESPPEQQGTLGMEQNFGLDGILDPKMEYPFSNFQGNPENHASGGSLPGRHARGLANIQITPVYEQGLNRLKLLNFTD